MSATTASPHPHPTITPASPHHVRDTLRFIQSVVDGKHSRADVSMTEYRACFSCSLVRISAVHTVSNTGSTDELQHKQTILLTSLHGYSYGSPLMYCT